MEYGIFNDEGCLERGMWSQEEANREAATYGAQDDVHVEALCPDHEEQPVNSCEECFAEVDA